MRDEPDIVKELRESEKLGLIQSNMKNAYEKLETIEKTSEEVSVEPIYFCDDKSENEERKYSNFQIAEMPELYKTVVELSPDGIVTVDLKGVITSCNTAGAKILGYSKEELVGRHFAKLGVFRMRDLPKILKLFSSIIKGKNVGPFELEYLHKDGTGIWCEVHVALLKEEIRVVGLIAISRDITNRKKSEELLKESEEKYRSLVTRANDGIAIIKDNNIKFLNHRAADMLGYTVDEILGTEFIKYIAPEVKDKLIERYRMRIDGKNPPEVYESLLMKKNGEIIPVEINAKLIKYGGESADMAIIRDITDRKQMEKELKEAKNHFQGMFNVMVDPVVIVDSKGKFLEITEKVEELTGYKKEELLGKNFLGTRIVTAKSKRILLKNLFKRMAGIKIKPYEIEGLTKDGKKIPFEVNASKIKYKEKTADMVVLRDISERKKAQLELMKSEERFRKFFENEPEYCYMINLDGTILDINSSALVTLGYTKDELVGKPVTTLYSPKSQKKAKELFEKWNKTGKLKNEELTILTKNHEERIVLLSADSMRDSQGKIIHSISVQRDITDRKKVEKDLKETHDKLDMLNRELEEKVKLRTAQVERLLQQKDEFIYQLGHDLKSPLTPLVSILPIIEKTEDDPKSKQLLGVLCRNVYYMKNLVVKTLELARLNAPSTIFDIKDINLGQELENSIKDQQLISDGKDFTVENKISENLFVKADKLRLGEVFNNLINNAVKYSPYGCTITVDAQDNGDFVTVSIMDSGNGMTAEQIDHIFDEFYKADKSRHDSGSSGLGLPICKRIVEKHGGRIWAVSPGPKKGSTFYFTIPKSSHINEYKYSFKNIKKKKGKR